MDMKLEVIVVPVSDVDRAKAFYERLGFRLDIDYAANENFRVIQFTPPHSEASIIFGKGITSAKSGSPDSLVLAVDDPRVGGHDPQGRSYYSFASFEDPDGNVWLLQEIKTRLPGREWKLTRAPAMNVVTMADLLHETEEHHGQYEKTHAEHHWWDWNAAYMNARESGSTPEQASAAAERYMAEAKHVVAGKSV